MTQTAVVLPVNSQAGERWLARHKWALLALVAVLVLSAGVRLLTYDRYFPFMDYSDETNMYLLARDWRGVEQVAVIPEWLAGYPPLYIWGSMAVQAGMEKVWPRPWILPSEYMMVMRLLAVAAGVLTTGLVAALGWQVAGPLAGCLAGAVWGLSPAILEYNNLAIPDPFVYLFCAAALVAALYAWEHESPPWLVASTVAALAAVLCKYPAVYALLPAGLVSLLLLRRSPRRMLPWVGLQVALVLAVVLIIANHGGFGLSNREADTAREEGLSMMFNLARELNNWRWAVLPIGEVAFLGALAASAAAWLYSRSRGWPRIPAGRVGLLLVYCVVGVAISAVFSNVSGVAGKIRHVLPMTLALAAVWGAALAQLALTLGGLLSRNRAKTYATALVGLAGALALVPYYAGGDAQVIQKFSQVDNRYRLWRWADVNVPPDGLILMDAGSELEATWNRPYSGYDGVKSFQWWFEAPDKIAASTPAQYAERGIIYFALSENDRSTIYNTPAMKAFIDRLTLVKRIEPAAGVVGSAAYFYRMTPPQRPADATFADQIVLTGYDLSSDGVKPGDTLRFRPYWRTLRLPATNYSMFVHLYPAGADQLITQHDGPLTVLERPTLTWDDTNELYIGPDVQLTVPPDTPPGDYRLVVGVYDYTTGIRLKVGDGDSFSIPVTVQPS
jgi:4-amino-4-deoxy-L-arabinose transferase-like glycosyltransferase